MDEIDYSKISVTAKLVAYFRQFSDIRFAPEVSEYVHAQEALEEIGRQLQGEEPDANYADRFPDEAKIYAPILEARYKSIVQCILKTGIDQVLELASGFSLRGLAMTGTPEFVYVESDLHGLNEEKNKLLTHIRAKHAIPDFGNHHIATANALSLSEMEEAVRPLRRDRRLVVVNEGLINYLSAPEREIVADNVRSLLGQFAGGVWITPDFVTRKVADDVSERTRRFRMAIAGTTERELYEAAFESEEAIDKFVADRGFSGTSAYQIDQVPALSSLQRLDLSSDLMERLKPRMRIWVLSPR